VNAYTNELVYAIAGPEFGELEGSIILIRKALYGLRSSGERWHAHFVDTLRSMGFVPTRFDNDVWIRKSEDGTHYEYVCTHVDDFMIVSKRPEAIMENLKTFYVIKSEGPPEYYLGNDYKFCKDRRLAVGCKKYLTEALLRVEKMFGTLKKDSIPMAAGDHPELDTSPLLNDDEHRKYQMLLGMLNWIVQIGRFDVAYATASLSRVTACPRKGHLTRVLRVFSYLKKRNNQRYVIDSRDPIFIGGEAQFEKDFTEELRSAYPDSYEEIDVNLPEALVDPMEITVFVDSDHAHDQVTRRSITGFCRHVDQGIASKSVLCIGWKNLLWLALDVCDLRDRSTTFINACSSIYMAQEECWNVGIRFSLNPTIGKNTTTGAARGSFCCCLAATVVGH
jgi:hypothetical protein